MPYAQYLQTAHWRTVRDGALRRAGFRCSKCTTKRELQVHHLTYERRGAELDTDIEVLCRGCHLGLHVHEAQQGIGVYLKIVRESLKAGQFDTVSDLAEDVKVRCALARIPYRDGQVQAAIARVEVDDKLTLGAVVPKKFTELLHARKFNEPFTRAEAAGLIAKYAAQGLIKPMPTMPAFTRKQADSLRVIKQIAALTIDQIAKCEEAERAAAEAEKAS